MLVFERRAPCSELGRCQCYGSATGRLAAEVSPPVARSVMPRTQPPSLRPPSAKLLAGCLLLAACTVLLRPAEAAREAAAVAADAFPPCPNGSNATGNTSNATGGRPVCHEAEELSLFTRGWWTVAGCAGCCLVCAALAAGLTMGLVGIDPFELAVSIESVNHLEVVEDEVPRIF